MNNASFQGKDISIFLGGALAPTAVAVSMLHGLCDLETEKALRLKLNDSHLWLPKKALIPVTNEYLDGPDTYYKLAKWFTFKPIQIRIVEKNLSTNGCSI